MKQKIVIEADVLRRAKRQAADEEWPLSDLIQRYPGPVPDREVAGARPTEIGLPRIMHTLHGTPEYSAATD